MTTINAPWSVEVIENLAKLQSGECYGHPYTCINRGDGRHHHNGNDTGCLIPTHNGWVCKDCDYTQEWVHASSTTMPLTADMPSILSSLMNGKGR